MAYTVPVVLRAEDFEEDIWTWGGNRHMADWIHLRKEEDGTEKVDVRLHDNFPCFKVIRFMDRTTIPITITKFQVIRIIPKDLTAENTEPEYKCTMEHTDTNYLRDFLMGEERSGYGHLIPPNEYEKAGIVNG